MAVVRRSLRAAGLVAMAMIGVLTASAPADANSGWALPFATLASTGPIGWPPVLADGQAGEVTALFATAKTYGAGGETLLSEDHSASGWGGPSTVPSGGNASQLALSSAGDAASSAGNTLSGAGNTPSGAGGADTTAVWVDSSDGNSFQIWTAERAPGKSWSAATELPFSGGSTDTVDAPGVVEDAQGDALAVWSESDRQHSRTWLLAASRRGGVWSTPIQLSNSVARVLEGASAQLTVDADGDFVVAWSQFLSATGVYAVQADELIGGVWQGQQTIESGGDAIGPVALSGNPAGDTTAVWNDVQQQSVHAAILRNGGWNAIAAPGGYRADSCQAPLPVLAVDAAGQTVAVWVQSDGQVAARTIDADGSQGAPAQAVSQLPGGVVGYHPKVAVDPAGDALVTWSYYDPASSSTFIQAASRPAGGTWSPPVTLSGPDLSDTAMSLAIDAQGNAIEAWAGSTTSSSFGIDAAEFDSTFSGNAASDARAPATAATLMPVYVTLSGQRIWLARGPRTVSVVVRNNNPSALTGTASIADYAAGGGSSTGSSSSSPAGSGGSSNASSTPASTTGSGSGSGSSSGSGSGGSPSAIGNTGAAVAAALQPLSTSFHFRVPARGRRRVYFRLSSAMLKRLRVQVANNGHGLVRIRLTAKSAAGQSSSSVGVYAFDTPVVLRRGAQPHQALQPGYGTPPDPWARGAC